MLTSSDGDRRMGHNPKFLEIRPSPSAKFLHSQCMDKGVEGLAGKLFQSAPTNPRPSIIFFIRPIYSIP